MPRDPRHRCPGCNAPGLHNRLLACAHCYARIPQHLRDALHAAYLRYRVDPLEYRAIRVDTIAWLRRNSHRFTHGVRP